VAIQRLIIDVFSLFPGLSLKANFVPLLTVYNEK